MALNEQTYPADQARRLKTPALNSQTTALIGVLLSVVLNAGGQVLFKAAQSGPANGALAAIFLRPETWAGFVLYGLSSLIWLWVLSRAQLSLAYPILALSFPIVVALSAIFFGESVSAAHWSGVAIIIAGVALLARS
jgi:drug/metabolite transporter (DMT)-like permease